jgi:CBS domain containing-hemolysin-like protein
MVLGNTFASGAMVALVLRVVLHGDWIASPAVLELLALMLLGCEVLPKTLAVRNAEQWALRVASPMSFLLTATRPLRLIAQRANSGILSAFIPKSVKPASVLTDGEYRELLELGFQQGSLGASEKEIILQIISLDKRTVKEVMKPRSQMACISDDLTVEEMIAAACKFKHRRLPIFDETPDTIVGVLNTRVLLLNPDADLVEAVEIPSIVPETMNLLQLLKALQRQQRGLAMVLDEFGGTAGLVTVEDILEEMVGEIRSELEPEGFVMERLAPGRWRVNGTMRLDDFRREYPELGEVPEVETMGGLLMDQLGVVPIVGQSTAFRGLRLTAQQADERRVRELLVETVKKKGGG